MAFFKQFKKNPTKILMLLVKTPCIFIGIFNTVEKYKNYLNYLNEYRIEILGIHRDLTYATFYYGLHGKMYNQYSQPMLSQFIHEDGESSCCLPDSWWKDESNHKFHSADPAIAATFNQRYSNKVVRKHNKRRHK